MGYADDVRRIRPWIVALIVLLGLACAPRARAAAPSGFRACSRAMTVDQVRRIFSELKNVSGRDGCKLEDVETRDSATRITWSRQGKKLPPVLVAPRGCLVSPNLEGPDLQAAVPPSVRTSCPTSYAKLRGAIGSSIGTLTTARSNGRSARPVAVPVTVSVFILCLLLALAIAIRSFRRRAPPGAETFRWGVLGACAFLLALTLRWYVEPALANWYAIVLPASGAMAGRFGAGGLVFQRALSLLLPWTDTTLFTVNAAIGALAVAIGVGIARERRLPAVAGGALAVLFALTPLHVRISASPSEHVLASTLALGALWLWLRAERLDSKLHRALALLFVAAAVLTRVEIWIQLAAVGIWGLLRDPQEQAPAPDRRWRFALVFAAAWALIGVFSWFAIVVPSHHPGPDLAGIRLTASQLLRQYWDVASLDPHWLSPLAVLLALPGFFYLLLRRWRLLAGIVSYLVLAFVPLGRTLQHDGILGARYFLATLPLFLMLSACGVYVCVCGVVWALGRVPQLARTARLEQVSAAVLLLAVGFGDLALIAPAYRARYTFQDEYDFLRQALARVPDGCTVMTVPMRSSRYRRDLDCCLEPQKSPLSLVYPRLRFASLDKPGDIRGPGCRYYYQSSACSIDLSDAESSPVDRPALHFLRQECSRAHRAPLVPVARARVSPRSTNRYFRRPPEVRLFRVAPAGSASPAPPKQ